MLDPHEAGSRGKWEGTCAAQEQMGERDRNVERKLIIYIIYILSLINIERAQKLWTG